MSTTVYTSDLTVDDAPKEALVESIRLREQRIASNIDELIGRLRPNVLAGRAVDKAAGAFTDAQGRPNAGRIAAAGGAVLVVAGLVVAGVLRKRGR